MTAPPEIAPDLATVLEVAGVTGGYGDVIVLRDISFSVSRGECLAILGPNGAGKSTLMKMIGGTLTPKSGHATLLGATAPAARIQKIGWVPEGRMLFGEFSVIDNLRLSARAAGTLDDFSELLEDCLTLFPALTRMLQMECGRLSGGQQQMVALSRALVRRPALLMLDEPSMGLAPMVVDDIRVAITELRRRGLSILIAEQNVSWLPGFVDRVAFLRHGRIQLEASIEILKDREAIRRLYLDQ